MVALRLGDNRLMLIKTLIKRITRLSLRFGKRVTITIHDNE
jgi:hypothetical protein